MDDWQTTFSFLSDDIDVRGRSLLGSPSLDAPALQVPTPPESHKGTPVDEPTEAQTHIHDVPTVSVSTTFHASSQLRSHQPNIILLSEDGVYFYLHQDVLLAASDNAFEGLLTAPARDGQPLVLRINDASQVFNVIAHTVYDMTCAHYSPAFDTLVTAIHRLPAYGVSVRTHLAPGSPLYNLLLCHSPLRPLESYALAAQYDLFDLAQATSSHLLSLPLYTVSDEMAQRIGPVYLKRLFFLHFGRTEALKRLLLQPPHPHAPTPWCDFTEQKKLVRAWALATAYLAWEARPDLSTSVIESSLNPLAEHLSCDECLKTLTERIKNLLIQWSLVKRTI
ncbi:hypothetical protein BD626DRAFT_110649 [Schizophyllum amplum]|uniref:BTB domain-containing protein n=1 Tax=Schizophyllum amplum TaxID=97359 RepID=A0A550CTF9_9AGAR|nr:hypothetical protein BD626DRAFT_110649 [Auriculariopsis ampla]